VNLDMMLYVLISYFLGSIPFGLILTKLATGKNLKMQGSHNIGATNAARIAGPLVGIATLILDVAKGFICVFVVERLGYSAELAAICGLVAFLGHCFPVWLRFSGGKGVATGLGVFAAISWWLVLFAITAFIAGYIITRQVGGGSLFAALVSIVVSIFVIDSTIIRAVVVMIAIITIVRHRDNMRRILSGMGTSLLLLFCACATVGRISPQALELERQCMQSLAAADYDGANSRCELCLEYDENVAECLNGLGLVELAKGNQDKAKERFAKAIQVNPSLGQARNNLGAIFFKKGEYKEALTLYLAALHIDPGYEDARYNTGLCYLKIGQQAARAGNTSQARVDFAEARSHYQKLLVVNPESAGAHRDLGLLEGYLAELDSKDDESFRRRIASAATHFKSCLQIEPKSEACHESYGQNLLFQKQFDEALYHFVQCLGENKDSPVCLEGLDLAYQGAQTKDKALVRYLGLLKDKPNHAEGHFGYCVALFGKSLNEQAVQECNKALELDKSMCDAHYQLAMHYKKVLNSQDALEHCRSYLLCDNKSQKSNQQKACQKVMTAMNGL